MLYELLHPVATPLAHAIWRPEVVGTDNVPPTGGVILASNHLSFVDSIVIPLTSPRQVAFLAKAEYFTGTGLKGRLLAWFYTVVGQVPIDRTDADSAQAALQTAVRILGEGKLLGMYPEGTRSPDGRLYKGKTGAARLALAAGVPIVPVAMLNSQLHRGPFGIPVLRRPGIRIGAPMDFSAYADQATNGRVLRWVTDEVMHAIAEMSGQTYVDVYAQSIKSGNYAGDVAAKVLDRPGGGPPPPTTEQRTEQRTEQEN